MSSDDVPQTPGHLYTWVDIDEYFTSSAVRGAWPPWLLEVDAFWDGAELVITDGVCTPEVWDWLAARLGPLTVDAGREEVLLESVDGRSRPLPVRLRTASQVVEPEFRPRWNEHRIVRQLAGGVPAPDEAAFPHDVQVCAFHAFRGGVGRTLHCVALARELASRPGRDGGHGAVLLVDADLHAPGITWMLAADGQRTDFALEDFLALLHGSSASDRDEVIALGRKFLLNQQLNNIILLPARRNPTRLGPPRIEPVDLLTHDRRPYFLTEALAELAHAAGADSVLLDLGAGVSESSSPVLLDPRVLRVFVTAMDDQSLRGTEHILREIACRAPSRRPSDPRCSVIVTRFEAAEYELPVGAAVAVLTSCLAATARPAAGTAGADGDADGDGDGVHDAGDAGDVVEATAPIDEEVATEPIPSPLVPQLLALPGGWNDVNTLIDRVGVRPRVEPLAEVLRPTRTGRRATVAAAAEVDLASARRCLHERAERLKYAERMTDEEGFLPTEALTNLVSAHRTDAPIEVVVGAKGSGKTLTHLRMCRWPTWSAFARALDVGDVELTAKIVPAFASQNLGNAVREKIVQGWKRTAERLSGAEPATWPELGDLIFAALGSDLGDVAWRRVWLAFLARAAGLDATPGNAEEKLTALARRHRVVFVVDGLEDLFQKFSVDPREQRALRALLTGCTEWLRSLRGRPLGLVVFVRRDLAFEAVDAVRPSTQPAATRFAARHPVCEHELRWNRVEALRLAAWVCARAGVLRPPAEVPIRNAAENILVELLFDVWGQRLGARTSRQARSEEWFLAALSDFDLQIQARDVVSFLAAAARCSAEDGQAVARWPDRLLAPAAMRRALLECSREKADAVARENRPVGEIFECLRRLPDDTRTVPFTLDAVRLSSAEARLLEANGVVFREHDEYWMPELYRHGLGFGLRNGAGRPRVLAIEKLTRRRRSADLPAVNPTGEGPRKSPR